MYFFKNAKSVILVCEIGIDMPIPPTPAHCTHSCYYHLFQQPCCASNSCLLRISAIFFHIFTACIPLITYHLIRCCRRCFTSKGDYTNLQNVAVKSVVKAKPKPYPKISLDAITFTKTSLKTVSYINCNFYIPGKEVEITQPLNEEIKKLYEVLRAMIKPGFNADHVMILSYTLCIWMLEELDAFAEKYKDTAGHKISLEEIVADKNHYFFYGLKMLPEIYHNIRGAAICKGDGTFEFPAKEIPKEFAKLFYKSGKEQNKWNRLYNDFCERVGQYLDLQKMDSTITKWFQKDTNIKTFVRDLSDDDSDD
jgi:hypothetical protein